MRPRGSRRRGLSVFPHSLERAAFVAYFLGAVVPLLALAFVVNRYAVPQLLDGPWPYALGALMLGFSGLSLGAFLLLRRATWTTLEGINSDNRRLETLLEGSGALGRAGHREDVIQSAVACAARLTGAEAAYVIHEAEGEEAAVLACQAGPGAEPLYAKRRAGLEELAATAMGSERPVVLGGRDPQAARTAGFVGVAVPLSSERRRGALVVANGSRGPELAAGPVGALSTLATLARVALLNAELRDAQQNFFVHVTDMLLGALDSHMDLQTGHARRVAHFSVQMGREVGLDDTRLQRLHFAALLHDIGMLKISPEARHSQQVCRQHPMLGFRMLSAIQLWEDLAPFVLHHHEWFDGSGYPKGIRGDEIPLESRIIGIAEAFDSMTSQSSYKSPVSTDEALRRLADGAGTQFDPELAPLFTELVRSGAIRAD